MGTIPEDFASALVVCPRCAIIDLKAPALSSKKKNADYHVDTFICAMCRYIFIHYIEVKIHWLFDENGNPDNSSQLRMTERAAKAYLKLVK